MKKIKGYLTHDEAAEMLGMTKGSLYNKVCSGKIISDSLPGNNINFYEIEHLKTFLKLKKNLK